MSSSIVITIVVLAAIAWVAYLGVSALRSRGSEEIPTNLAPGITDDVLETKRLERTQMGAVLLSAFLAVAIPVYYLTETSRQEGFVEEFSETAIEHGHEWYIEFQCGNCHGADGGGGAASYVEKRTGVTVTWAAPSINDVFYRYSREEVKYWIVYGRGNSPMPAWGLPGGGPMNDSQVEELLDYLESEEFSVAQGEVLAEVEPTIASELSRLENAEALVAQSLLDQRQTVASMYQEPALADPLTEVADRANTALENAGQGIDTDGDGLSDTAEAEIVALNLEARTILVPEGLSLDLTFEPDDPATNGIPDVEAAQNFLDVLEDLSNRPLEAGAEPVLGAVAEAVASILAGDDPESLPPPDDDALDEDLGVEQPTEDDPAAGEGTDADSTDSDGDGLTDSQEQQLTAQAQVAVTAVVDLNPVQLDPQSEETSIGVPDQTTANEAVAAIQTRALNARVTTENFDRILPPAIASLENLQDAADNQRWVFDFEAIAENIDADVETAERVVGLYNGYCARCHTSGYSAGIAFTQKAGSGGLGPALWEGRPAVQFLTDQDLVDFLIVGAEPNQPYGVNGFGSGRMPAFGQILSIEDLELLANWLRQGDLTGSESQAQTAGGN